MTGWFAVKRGITSHPIFKGHPERLAVWLWLLDNVAWKDTTHDVKGKTINVPRGSVCASERHIADECGVGYQVVRTFLKRLKNEHMINAQVTHGKNVITLCNWDKYQQAGNKANAEGNAPITQDQRTKETREQIPVGEDASATSDPSKVMFDAGKRILTSAGKSQAEAGRLLGKWRKDHGEEAVIAALGRCQREGAIDPVSYITGCLKFHKSRQPQERPGYTNAGAFGNIPEVC